MLQTHRILKKSANKFEDNATYKNEGGEQISYERSSQAQSLTRPPILLSAAGYVDIRRMAFHVI